MTTKHAIGPLVWVVRLLVVALAAWKSAAATWETKPAVALHEVLARATMGQRLAHPNAEIPLVPAGILQLPARRQPLPLLRRDLAPVGDARPQQLGPLDGQVQLGVASGAVRAPAIAGARVPD
eukprot:CAMPEP_0198603478 /NCGR_PEP_ID=MMETSP1462-20131121/152045_1 /TAXON_ID=1333877 /ORGANISM="Brandtodinium nutriculum, Strain RCC3387" /LENGTH=122 /DNA_ID=CAMNT_0044335251 /DNA_START=255 /DNA_END=620 /DNA_ORIENTATION=+